MKLLIRADSGPCVGTGHVMRMIAMAGAWKRMGGQTVFACGDLPGTLQQRLLREDIHLETILPCDCPSERQRNDAIQTAAIAGKINADWVVADGYAFDDSWQAVIKAGEFRLMVVDDFAHAAHSHADLVLNQNIYACHELYPDRTPESLLCGANYLMMRSEFSPQNLAPTKARSKRVKRILVTMGGADPDNHSLSVLRTLELIGLDDARYKCAVKSVEIDLVTGAEFAHRDSIDKFAEQCTAINVCRHHDVQRMSDLMVRADLAISAAGTTSYELARCGVAVISVSIADNQIRVAKALEERGTVVYAGHHEVIGQPSFADLVRNLIDDPEKRKRMSETASRIVDGRGAGRIADRLADAGFSLRPATMDDCELMLQWRNEPETRAVSFLTKPIGLESHRKWLAARISDKNCLLRIVTSRTGANVGQVRIDLDPATNTAYITVGLDPSHRGRGLGAMLIGRATRTATESLNVDRIVAQIKPANIASKNAFAKAGYHSIAPTVICGEAALQMAWTVEHNGRASALKTSA